MSIAYPEDGYLLLVGRLAYAVSSLEGFVVYELPRLRILAPDLPDDLTPETLASKSTGTIAGMIRDSMKGWAAPSVPQVKVWLELGATCLGRAAEIRNPVLHARPATIGDQQLLHRWRSRGLVFTIDNDRLLGGIATLEQLSSDLYAQRIPFPPATNG